jgi:hypothetical protein
MRLWQGVCRIRMSPCRPAIAWHLESLIND